MIVVPETILYKLVRGLLTHVKVEYDQATDKSTTLIYQIFYGLVEDKKNYYTEAVDLFTREITHPRSISVRKFFDAERARIPTIHITMQQELSNNNSIGVDESSEVYSHTYQDIDDKDITTIQPILSRRFDANYNLICTSDNHAETLLMYHLVRACLISIFDSISLVGLQNPRLSGQDLRLDDSNTPPHIFMRAITIASSYDVSVPRWFTQDILSDMMFCVPDDQIITN